MTDLHQKLQAAQGLISDVSHALVKFQNESYEKLVDASNILCTIEDEIKKKGKCNEK